MAFLNKTKLEDLAGVLKHLTYADMATLASFLAREFGADDLDWVAVATSLNSFAEDYARQYEMRLAAQNEKEPEQ